MIHPIYKFELTSVYGQTVNHKTVYPIYKDSTSIDYAIEQNEQFYRAKLSGELVFTSADYEFINSKVLETEFELRLFISYNAGASWTQQWTGRFWKTDCKFDVDDKKITVTPTVSDEYSEVLAGLDKEYNLIELKPEISHIKVDKRPMIQVYSPGESVIACFLSGMYWEQDCTPETNESKLTELGDGKLNFAKCSSLRIVDIEEGDVSLPKVFYGPVPDSTRSTMDYTNGGYRFMFEYFGSSSTGVQQIWWRILRASDDVELWNHVELYQDPPSVPYEVTLHPVSGTGATGTVKLYVRDQNIYSRYVLDVEYLDRLNTYLLPEDDIVSDNRNYRRCIAYEMSNIIYYSDRVTTTPTKYGIYEPGKYYQEPYILGINKFYPVARSAWGAISIWFAFTSFDWILEQQARKAYMLKDSYPLASVISVLLGKIAPGVLHEATTEYSEFLYGENPLSRNTFELFLTQKSNILAGDYDKPAQKAPVTLKQVLDMLRDCYRCYWFIERAENGDLRFRIEHISWFLKGGTYVGSAIVGTDLTAVNLSRNGKNWAFGTSKYSYNKDGMPERYQFGWMDEVTELFEGFPIDINSKFVERGKIEEKTIANFTSDVDYMLLNPGACTEDGFALLAAVLQNGRYELPYLTFNVDDVHYYVQNGYASFYYLQFFYLYDMPSRNISARCYGGGFVRGIKKQKMQEITYPEVNEPELYKLVKTNLGNGRIEKISINLPSRKAQATLSYDTE